jgi:hypothetical protein
MVIPPNTTPITAVQVYSDEPRCRAISRAATNSRTIMQKLEINTVAPGISIGRKVLGLLISRFFPFSIVQV